MISLLLSVNISLKSLYSLEIDNLITKSEFSKTIQLYSIFILRFLSFLHGFSAVIMKIFTPLDEHIIKYSFTKVNSFTKYILFQLNQSLN